MPPDEAETGRRRILCAWAIALAGRLWIESPRLNADYFAVDSYAANGERLIHGVAGANSYRLPLSTVFAALAEYHWRVPPAAALAIYWLTLAALVLALEKLVGIRAYLGAASAAALIFFPWSYPQAIFALLVLLVAGALALRAQETPPPFASLLLSLAIGVSLTFRSTLAFLPPALALHELLARDSRPRRTRWKRCAVLLIVPYLFLIPWVRMNWTIHRRIIPFEDGAAGANVAAGALGATETIRGPWDDVPLRPAADASPLMLWAVKTTLAHPLRDAAAFLTRALLALFWLAPFSLLGLWALWTRREEKKFQALGLLIGYYIGIHCLMAIQRDYFLPLEPLFMVLAVSLLERRAPPRNGSTPSKYAKTAVVGVLGLALALCLYASALVAAYPTRRLSPDAALKLQPGDPWLLCNDGEDLLRRGLITEAIDRLSRCRRLSPSPGIDAQRQLAEARMIAGDDAAIWALPSTSTPGHDASETRLLRAAAWLRRSKPDEARKELTAALDAYISATAGPDLPGAAADGLRARMRAVGLDYFVRRSFKSTFAAFPASDKNAMASLLTAALPSSRPAWILRAEWLEQDGRVSQARATLAEASVLEQSAPENIGALIEESQVYTALDQRSRALSVLTRAAALGPESEDRRRLADAYVQLGQGRLALEQLRTLPPQTGTLIEEGRAYAALNQPAQALSALAQAARLASDADDRRGLADVYERLGQERLALEQLTALPPQTGTLIEEGRDYAALGLRAQALSALARAAELSPGPEDRGRLADAYIQLGQGLLALEQLRGLPPQPGTLIKEGQAYAALRQTSRESSALAAAEKLNPSFSQKFEIALLLQDSGNYDAALRLLDGLLREKPGSAELLNARGICQYLAGSIEDAARTLESAVRQDPDFLPAYMTLGSIYAGQRRDKDAAALYRSALTRARPGPVRLELEQALRSLGSTADRPAGRPPTPRRKN